MRIKRQIIVYKQYFTSFYEKQPSKVQAKIEWTIRVMEHVPSKYFKHLAGTEGLYEIRVEYQGNIYRIFSFFDKGDLVVLGNAFQKKTQKISRIEIKKAQKIMKEYYDEKK